MDHADPLDDELAPALMGDRLNALALDHLGGNPETDAIMAFNRQTAAILTATLVLVQPGQSVIGVSATGSHACVVRAAKRAGRTLSTLSVLLISKSSSKELPTSRWCR